MSQDDASSLALGWHDLPGVANQILHIGLIFQAWMEKLCKVREIGHFDIISWHLQQNIN